MQIVKTKKLFVAGDIGGVCGVFIGFSLISIVELVYFTTLFFVNSHKKQRERDSSPPREKFILNHDENIRTIYWNEITNTKMPKRNEHFFLYR